MVSIQHITRKLYDGLTASVQSVTLEMIYFLPIYIFGRQISKVLEKWIEKQ